MTKMHICSMYFIVFLHCYIAAALYFQSYRVRPADSKHVALWYLMKNKKGAANINVCQGYRSYLSCHITQRNKNLNVSKWIHDLFFTMRYAAEGNLHVQGDNMQVGQVHQSASIDWVMISLYFLLCPSLLVVSDNAHSSLINFLPV